MSHLTITAIAQRHALTVPKAKKVLIDAGLMHSDGRPDDSGIASGLVQKRMIEDQFGDGRSKIYYAWDYEKVKHLYLPATELEKFLAIRSRVTAERRFCEAYTRAARILGMVGDERMVINIEPGLSAATMRIVERALVYDPHFVGGFGAIQFCKGAREIRSLFAHARTQSEELVAALDSRNAEEAQFFIDALSGIESWLLKQ